MQDFVVHAAAWGGLWQDLAARVAAQERALATLAAWAGPQRMASYTGRGWFEVTSDKGHRWRIGAHSSINNVSLMGAAGDTPVACYCAAPEGDMPLADVHLAQALVLSSDEDAFLAVAWGSHPGTNSRWRGLPPQWPARAQVA